MRALIFALLLSSCPGTAPDGQSPPDGPQLHAVRERFLRAGDSQTGLYDLTLDELIDRLPRIGFEHRLARTGSENVFNAASVEMSNRLLDGATLTDSQWRSALMNSGAIRWRKRWPVDRNVAVSIGVPSWLRFCEIRAQQLGGEHGSCAAGVLWPSFCGMGLPQRVIRWWELGPLPLGDHSIEFSITIERGRGVEHEASFRSLTGENCDQIAAKPGILWTGRLGIELTIVETMDDAVPGFATERLANAVRDSIGAGIHTPLFDEEQKVVAFLAIEPDRQAFPELIATALSLEVSLLRDGIERNVSSWWLLERTRHRSWSRESLS